MAIGAALLLGAGASPAAAADQIGLSRDGRSWSSTLGTPVFDPAVRWVPGDVRQARFYVRNQAAQSGLLSLQIDVRDPDSLLAGDDVRLQVRRDSGAWTPVRADGRSVLVGGAQLAPATSTRVEVRATFVAGSPNPSQRTELELGFSVALVEQNSDVEPPGGFLPQTGGIALVWVRVGFGLLALGAGILIALRRTHRRKDHHVSAG